MREVEPLLAVHAHQLAIDADRRAARRQPKHRVLPPAVALADHRGHRMGHMAGQVVARLEHKRGKLRPPSAAGLDRRRCGRRSSHGCWTQCLKVKKFSWKPIGQYGRHPPNLPIGSLPDPNSHMPNGRIPPPNICRFIFRPVFETPWP